jgi:methionine-rich copper-binding protein CopC
MRGFFRIAFVLTALWLPAHPHASQAHAIIVSSSPATGATISGDTVAIRLHFNSRIDHARSKLTLLAPDGASPAGTWHLRWQVLSVDGHITRGDIPFTVR